MTEQTREFGLIGLGRMGGSLALHAMEKGYRVVGYRTKGAPEHLTQAGLIEARGASDLRDLLSHPRVMFLYVPAGPPIDRVLDDLVPHLEPGDIVVDGGNSYWGDSVRRHERLQKREIRFVDLGTSGGICGARHGACFMAGGDNARACALRAGARDNAGLRLH